MFLCIFSERSVLIATNPIRSKLEGNSRQFGALLAAKSCFKKTKTKFPSYSVEELSKYNRNEIHFETYLQMFKTVTKRPPQVDIR